MVGSFVLGEKDTGASKWHNKQANNFQSRRRKSMTFWAYSTVHPTIVWCKIITPIQKPQWLMSMYMRRVRHPFFVVTLSQSHRGAAVGGDMRRSSAPRAACPGLWTWLQYFCIFSESETEDYTWDCIPHIPYRVTYKHNTQVDCRGIYNHTRDITLLWNSKGNLLELVLCWGDVLHTKFVSRR